MKFKLKQQQMAKKTGDIDKIMIQDILEEHGVVLQDLVLGDFDKIGEFTAKKTRGPESELYRNVGCFFRPNYERGLFVYSLIKKYKITKFLEIGFGRGYTSYCAAMAMTENGTSGKIVTVDPFLNEKHVNQLAQMFPRNWTEKIKFIKDYSQNYLSNLNEEFELIFIDGDHKYEAVKQDWENTKDKFTKFLIFDDYHLPSRNDADVQCAEVVDQIDNFKKQLIIGDRRIFLDDRGYKDEEIDYGQVLLTHPSMLN